jgi:hypothetical protein
MATRWMLTAKGGSIYVPRQLVMAYIDKTTEETAEIYCAPVLCDSIVILDRKYEKDTACKRHVKNSDTQSEQLLPSYNENTQALCEMPGETDATECL